MTNFDVVAGGAAFKFSLPPSVFSAAIFTSILWPKEDFVAHLAWTLSSWILSFAALAAQAVLVNSVAGIVDENNIEEPCAEGGDAVVRYLTCGIFCAYMLRELMETGSFHSWLQHIGSADCGSQEPCKMTEVKGARGDTFFRPAFGIPIWKRSIFYLLLFCKLAVAVALLYFGSAYIVMAKDNENLILNTVAMLFIVEVDDVLYVLCVNDMVKNVVEDFPQLGRDWEESMEKACFYSTVSLFTGYLVPLALVIICVLLSHHWCSGFD